MVRIVDGGGDGGGGGSGWQSSSCLLSSMHYNKPRKYTSKVFKIVNVNSQISWWPRWFTIRSMVLWIYGFILDTGIRMGGRAGELSNCLWVPWYNHWLAPRLPCGGKRHPQVSHRTILPLLVLLTSGYNYSRPTYLCSIDEHTLVSSLYLAPSLYPVFCIIYYVEIVLWCYNAMLIWRNFVSYFKLLVEKSAKLVYKSNTAAVDDWQMICKELEWNTCIPEVILNTT